MAFHSVAKKDDGNRYEKLIEAVLLNYIDCITKRGHFRIAVSKKRNRSDWLRNQKEWVIKDDFWFKAYEECFDYDAEKMKQGILILINKQIREAKSRPLKKLR